MPSTGTVSAHKGRRGEGSAPVAPPSPPTRRSLLLVGGALVVLVVVALAVFVLDEGWEKPSTLDAHPRTADRFDRQDADRLGRTDEGQAWEAVAGRWGVLQGRARAFGPVPNDLVVLATSRAVADGRIAVTMPSVADDAGLAFRARGVNDLWAVVRGPAGTWVLLRSVDGQVERFVLGHSSVASAGDRVEVRLDGGIIDVWVNGTFLGGVYDTTFDEVQEAGLVGRGPSTVFARWDDFEVHDDL